MRGVKRIGRMEKNKRYNLGMLEEWMKTGKKKI